MIFDLQIFDTKHRVYLIKMHNGTCNIILYGIYLNNYKKSYCLLCIFDMSTSGPLS
jgi:hypothetical protein